MLEEHTWVAIFEPYSAVMRSKARRWIIACGDLFAFLFMNTIVTAQLYADNGYCDKFLDEASCATAHSTGEYATCEVVYGLSCCC